MDLILLSARIGGQATAECAFGVSIDGGPITSADTTVGGQSRVILPPGSNLLDIQATPTTKTHWPVRGSFEYKGNGTLTATDAPAEFEPPRGVTSVTGDSLIVVTVHLSRLRNATESALTTLINPPANRTKHVPPKWPPAAAGMPAGYWPPVAWDTPLLDGSDDDDASKVGSGLNYIADDPVVSQKINVEKRSLDPDTDDFVLELKDVPAPQTLAVSWPRTLAPSDGADPTPFLIYFHANVSQNAGDFYTHPLVGTYPFGFDYVYYGLWRYMNYTGDPLKDTRDPVKDTCDPWAKGLPYQVAASGKDVVVVLPCNRVGPEVGVFLSAASAAEILREIQEFAFRRAGVYVTPPGIGRTALAGFSQSNNLVAHFLTLPENQAHSFYLELLKELYMFDAPTGVDSNWISAAMRWARSGHADDKMVRVYQRKPAPNFSLLLSPNPVPSAQPYVASSKDGFRTASVLPNTSWFEVSPVVTKPEGRWEQAHQLVSALMLTDALRRSGF